MKNFLFGAITVLSIAFLISCTAQSSDPDNTNIADNPANGIWQDQPESPLDFKLEQTYGDDEEILFAQSYQLRGPVIDSIGNLYVIDGQNGTMYSFDPEGNLRWQTGEEGKGPGDFERPRGLVTDGEYIYTANVSGSRIDQFDLEGNLINTTSLENLGLSFVAVQGFISDSLLVTTSSLRGEVATEIVILNAKNNLDKVTQFKITSTSDIDLPEGFGYGFGIGIADSLIAAGNVQDYAIQFFDRNGERVRTVTREFNKLMRPGFAQSGSSRTIRGYGNLGAPIHLSNGYYLSTLSWPTNVKDPDAFLEKSRNNENAPEVNFANAIDLYNTDGTLLYSLEQEGMIPDIGSISHVDEDGYLYTKSNHPFPQIRRYSLTINAPNE